MKRGYDPIVIIVFGLLILGIVITLLTRPSSVLLPVVIFGAIYLLYKFPPKQWKNLFDSSSVSRRDKQRKKRKDQFKVIDGNKNNKEDDPPPYH